MVSMKKEGAAMDAKIITAEEIAEVKANNEVSISGKRFGCGETGRRKSL